jgi:hypothetical protein
MRVKSLVATASAVAVFLWASEVIRGFVPWPADLRMRPKLEAFEQQKDEIDAIFFGSSRAYRDIVPVAFDAVVEERGRPFRSFNLGLQGGWAYEVDHLLEHVLEMRPKRLRYVILEVQSFGPWLPERNRFSERSVYWHCLHHTLHAMHRSWQLFVEHLGWVRTAAAADHEKGPLDLFSLEYLALGWDHLKLWGWRLGNYGAGPRMFLAATGLDGKRDDPYRANFAAQRGFEGLDEIDPAMFADRNERRRRFERNLDGYQLEVDDLRENQFEELVPLPEKHLAMFERQLERIREMGLRVILVIPPGTLRDKEVETMKVRGLLPGVHWFQDPVAHPQLYELDARFDGNHLNTAGAEAFSRLFARSAAEELAE